MVVDHSSRPLTDLERSSRVTPDCGDVVDAVGVRALLTATYRAFNARDLEAALRVLHPAVDWANGMEDGRVHGRDAVRDYWTRQWGVIDPHVEPRGFSTDETGRVVVEVHQVVRDLAGRVLSDQTVRHAYVIEDGLVRRMDIQK